MILASNICQAVAAGTDLIKRRTTMESEAEAHVEAIKAVAAMLVTGGDCHNVSFALFSSTASRVVPGPLSVST